jgi:hypothetical protein
MGFTKYPCTPLKDYTILYLEYQSVCPFVQREGQHSLAGEGKVGANSDDWRKSFALCLLCAVPPQQIPLTPAHSPPLLPTSVNRLLTTQRHSYNFYNFPRH